jgi:hypothetical protein
MTIQEKEKEAQHEKLRKLEREKLRENKPLCK